MVRRTVGATASTRQDAQPITHAACLYHEERDQEKPGDGDEDSDADEQERLDGPDAQGDGDHRANATGGLGHDVHDGRVTHCPLASARYGQRPTSVTAEH
jgi:hypothetical protein